MIHSSSKERDDSPIRSIACLKNIEDIKRFEENEDCFILEFNPYEPSVPLLIDGFAHHHNDDLSIVAEKGQVACRDYPHSRHMCLKFPFNTTPHESYCEMCYCYICDSAAPCKQWTQPAVAHCDANNSYYWKEQREIMKLFSVM